MLDLEKLKKELLYKCNYRGCKETDIILGNFTKKYINELNTHELLILKDLAIEPDGKIMDWCTGKEAWPRKYGNSGLIEKIAKEFEISTMVKSAN